MEDTGRKLALQVLNRDGTRGGKSYIRRLERAADPWSFVEALRGLRFARNGGAWLVARDSRMPFLWLRGDGTAYTADARTVQAIRRGSIRLSRLSLQQSQDPAPGNGSRAGLELSWFAGYHASARLAPQLRSGLRYRIARLPNFALIKPFPSTLRVVSALAAAPAELGEVSGRARVTTEEAVRTLNALHACDALAVALAGETAAHGRAREDVESSGLVRLLDTVRRRVGRGGG